MRLKIDAEMDLDEGEILDLLNSRPTDSSLVSEPLKTKRSAERTSDLHRNLRDRMDAWIETGRSPEGREQPAKRSVEQLERQSYVNADADLDPLLRDWYWYGSQVQLRAKLQSRSGSTLVTLNFGGEIRKHAEATTMMLKVLLSDFRFRIAKCRHCNRYFVLPKVQPKKVYANGTFCTTFHNRAWSATKRTFERRLECKNKRIEWAAARLVLEFHTKRAPTDWWKDDALADKMVRAVNQQLVRFAARTVDEVKRNWIRLHRKEIQEKASELENSS